MMASESNHIYNIYYDGTSSLPPQSF